MHTIPVSNLCEKIDSPCTEEEGGALFNAGRLEAFDTDFAENVAGDNGLAIRNDEPEELVLRNVTFGDNLLRCPPEEYNTDDVSLHYSRSHEKPSHTGVEK